MCTSGSGSYYESAIAPAAGSGPACPGGLQQHQAAQEVSQALVASQSGEGSGAKPSDYAKLATDWLNVACGGGRGCLIGGCCRTTPEHIAAVAGACKPLAAV